VSRNRHAVPCFKHTEVFTDTKSSSDGISFLLVFLNPSNVELART
jgi:hypothetical protein